ncbi:uncharacterized protein LOC124808575 [Hydra vulgaris]|uniref:uncharacterized protein LOC124808575 n=1 Tax=Hydra vulgaris TaxID=6087 RepID=UPI001F5F575E|nr:uncharacterized protein LOC124808575 [Hydra vulgaris]
MLLTQINYTLPVTFHHSVELIILNDGYGNLSEEAISKLTKDDAWSKIADQVSLVGSDRTVLQCKKKLSDQKSDSKRKAARIISSLNKTDGGEGCLEELNSIDQQMVSKMPKAKNLQGITGGIDSL